MGIACVGDNVEASFLSDAQKRKQQYQRLVEILFIWHECCQITFLYL